MNNVAPRLSEVGYDFLAEDKGSLGVDIHATVVVLQGKGGSIARDDYPRRIDKDIHICNISERGPCYKDRRHKPFQNSQSTRSGPKIPAAGHSEGEIFLGSMA